MGKLWNIVKRIWPILAVVAFAMMIYGLRLENRLAGALEREDEISTRNYQVRAAKLAKGIARLEDEAGRLKRRVFVSDSLAALRPRISVKLPGRALPGSAVPTDPEPVVVAVDTARRATVTINDTSYAVPVRVAQVVEQQRLELVHADSLRKLADTTATTATNVAVEVKETVAAADTAIAAAKKKPGWLRRALGKSVTVLCAAGGAGVGAAVGTITGGGGAIPGAIVGAGAGVGICEFAR